MDQLQSSSHNHHRGQPRKEDENDEDNCDNAVFDINHREDWVSVHASTAAVPGGEEGGGGAAFSDDCLALSTAFDLASPEPDLGFPCLPDEPLQPPPSPSPIPPPLPALEKKGGTSKGRVKKAGEVVTARAATGAARSRVTVDRGFRPWPSAVKKRPRGSCEVCFQLKAQCDNTFPCGRCVLHKGGWGCCFLIQSLDSFIY
jgi:hypothetical protein